MQLFQGLSEPLLRTRRLPSYTAGIASPIRHQSDHLPPRPARIKANMNSLKTNPSGGDVGKMTVVAIATNAPGNTGELCFLVISPRVSPSHEHVRYAYHAAS